MIKRSTKYAFEGLAALGAVILLAIAGLTLVLSQGPISLTPIMPWIEALVQDEEGTDQLAIRDMELFWDSDEFRLGLRAFEVALRRNDGQTLVSVPQVDMSLSAAAIRDGVFAPAAIRLTGLSLSVLRRENGQFDLGPFSTPVARPTEVAPQQPDLQNLFTAIEGGADLPEVLRYLELIQVNQAKLHFRDNVSGAEWLAPEAQVSVVRRSFGLAARIAGKIEGGQGERWPVLITLALDQKKGAGRLGMTFEDVRLAELIRRVPNLSFLNGVEVDVSGDIIAPFTIDGRFQTVDVKLQAADGRITLPAIDDDTIAFDFATVAARMEPGPLGEGAAKVLIDDLQLSAGDVAINAAGWYDRQAPDSQQALKITGGLSNVSIDALKKLWPSELGKGAQNWMVANMDAGRIPTGTFHIDMTTAMLAGDAPLQDQSLDVLFELDDGVAHYLRPMPPLTEATATGHLTGKSFSMKVHRALVRLEAPYNDVPIELINGEFRIADFTQKPSVAEVTLTASGSVDQVLRLIDLKPLGFPSRMGLDPATTAGASSSDLRLTIPLIKDLQLDDLAFAVRSNVQDGLLPPIIDGIVFDQAQLGLNVTAQGLRAVGAVSANGVPLQVSWSEAFKKDETPDGLTTKVEARGLISPDDCIALNLPCGDWYEGVGDITLNVAGSGADLKTMSLSGDLSALSFIIPYSGWSKTMGDRLDATVDLVRRDDGGWNITDARGHGDRIRVLATGKLARDFSPEYINANELVLGPLTGLSAIVDWADLQGLGITLDAERLDMRGLFGESGFGGEDDGEGDPISEAPFRFSGKIKTLWLSDEFAVRDVEADAIGSYLRPDHLNFEAIDPNGQPVSATVRQLDKKRREARIAAEDLGLLLKASGFAPGLSGGVFRMILRYGMDDFDYTGNMMVRNITITNAPFIAQLGNLSTPGGIATMMQGGGVRLTDIELPFSARQGVIAIIGGRAVGPTIGAHFDGAVWEEDLALDLLGTVAPAYQLNAVLSQVPIIGEALAGGKEGLVAFRFWAKGTLDNPKITFNPLTALTPGFLRNIFGGQEKPAGLPELHKPDGASPGQ